MRRQLFFKILIILAGVCFSLCSSASPVRVALVLGSGGARGYAHIGVIQELERAGVPIDLIVGASSGSLIGALYADSGNAAQLEQIMLSTNLRTFLDISLLPGQGGVITGSSEQKFLAANLQAKDFADLKIPLVVVATNLQTGEAVTLSSGPLLPAIHASTALPGLVRPVHLNNLILIDGGVAEPIPVAIAKRYHPQVIIAINVSSSLPDQPPTLAYGIYKSANLIMWQRFSNYSAQGADFIIKPKVGQIGTFALQEKKYLITVGAEAANQSLPKIMKLLQQHHIPLNKEATTHGTQKRP